MKTRSVLLTITALSLTSCAHDGITFDVMLGKKFGKAVVTVQVPRNRPAPIDISPAPGLRIVERQDEPELPVDAITSPENP